MDRDVRKAALRSIAITPATYRDLLIRIRDASDDVRHAALESLDEHLDMKIIPVNDRAYLLDQGLQDRSPVVRRACEKMLLKSWLPACDNSPVTLLKAIDIEQFPALGSRVCKLVLQYRSENNTLNQDVEPYNALEVLSANDASCDAESVFYWKEQCHFYQNVYKDVEKIGALLPNITDFCKLLVATCSTGSDMIFIAQQLLALGQLLDFQDEYGRRKLLECLRKCCHASNVDSTSVVLTYV